MNEILVIIGIIFLLFIFSNYVSLEGLEADAYNKDTQANYSATYGTKLPNYQSEDLGKYTALETVSDDEQLVDYLSDASDVVSSHKKFGNQATVADLLHIILYDK